MKIIHYFSKFLYLLFCILIILFICTNLFVLCFISQHIVKSFDFQLIFYFLLSVTIILVLISAIFSKKLSFRFKIFISMICFLTFIIFGNLPTIKKINDIKICYKTGICAKGLTATTKDNINFLINKGNCKKYNYTWNTLRQTCDLRSEKLNKTK